MKILLVEDDFLYVVFLCDVVGQVLFEVSQILIVENGCEGEVMVCCDVQVVVMDLQMKECNGIDVVCIIWLECFEIWILFWLNYVDEVYLCGLMWIVFNGLFYGYVLKIVFVQWLYLVMCVVLVEGQVVVDCEIYWL